ncbi:MAG: DUF975 family protein [Clostridia bacterium]|nr:DUF975 family protein [Clostridia bacterium]
MPHIIPAFEFRRRARQAMKPVMPILLIVAMLAALPSLINDAVMLVADADPNQLLTTFSNRLTQVLEGAGLTQPEVLGEVAVDEVQLAKDILAVQESYLTDVQTFLKEKGLLIGLLTLMVTLLGPVLNLGLINANLHALRKKEFTAAIALSRMKYILKAVGLMLLVAVRVFLWMLPGMALTLAALFVDLNLATLLMIAGMITMIVMGIMASYRYALAVYVLADEPSTKLRQCVRRSCEVMHKRKFELFSLEISFIGWSLLLTLVQSMLDSFGPVISMTLSMFASLFLTVYTSCAQAAFYQEYAVGKVELPPQQDLPPEELA